MLLPNQPWKLEGPHVKDGVSCWPGFLTSLHSPTGNTFQASLSTRKCLFLSNIQNDKYILIPFLTLTYSHLEFFSVGHSLLSCITSLLRPAGDMNSTIWKKYYDPQMKIQLKNWLEKRHEAVTVEKQDGHLRSESKTKLSFLKQ